MRGMWVEQTHNGTGGSGALTLAAVTGSPTFANDFGSTGTRIVEYVINEYTDSTRTVLSQAEHGYGSIVLSTGVLTRTTVLTTWNGTTYNDTSPTALTIGNTAANIRIVSAQTIEGAFSASYPQTAGPTDFIGISGLGAATASTATIGPGTSLYILEYIPFSGRIANVGARVTTATTGGSPTLNAALYEVASNGLPGARLAISGTSMGSTSTTGNKTAALAATIRPPPGWYWTAILPVAGGATGSPLFRGKIPLVGPGGFGMGNATAMGTCHYVTTQTALNDPGTAPNTNLAVAAVPIITWYA